MSGFLGFDTAAIVSLSGDVTGTTNANTVTKLQGNPVAAGTLGSAQDGYVLIWNGTEFDVQTIGAVYPDVASFSTVTAALMTGNSTTGKPLSFPIANIPLVGTTYTLSSSDAAARFLRFSGTPGGTVTVTMPTSMASGTSPVYDVFNGSNQSITFSPGATVLPAGLKTILYYSGTAWVTGAIIVGGDLSATTNTAQIVTKVSGSGSTDDFGNAGATANISASETIFNSNSTAPIISETFTATTTSTTAVTIGTFAPVSNSINDFSVSLVGFNTSNNGDFYRGDLNFTVWDTAGTLTMTPSSPSASNVRSAGSGSTYVISASVSGSNVLIQVAGNAATTVHWSSAIQIMKIT